MCATNAATVLDFVKTQQHVLTDLIRDLVEAITICSKTVKNPWKDSSSISLGTAGIAGITAKVIAKPKYRRIRGDTKRAPVTVITISMAEIRVYGQK